LILNNVQPGKAGEKPVNVQNNGIAANNCNKPQTDVAMLLKDLIDVQKESLSVQKQKLEIEKQRLEFDRLIGTQMVTLIPMLSGLLQKFSANASPEKDIKVDTKMFGLKRKHSDSEEEDENGIAATKGYQEVHDAGSRGVRGSGR